MIIRKLKKETKKRQKEGFIMKKKLVSILMASLMAFSLAACGGGDDKDKDSSGKTTLRLALWDYDVDKDMYDPIIEALRKRTRILRLRL